MVPGEVGRRIAAALGITGTMIAFKGRQGPPPAKAPQETNQNGKSSEENKAS